MSLTPANIIERTGNLYNIFKLTVKLNPKRFAGKSIEDVIAFLKEQTGVKEATINEGYLATCVQRYCKDCDIRSEFDADVISTGIDYFD